MTSILPQSARFVSAPVGCAYGGRTRTVTCDLGNMADGAVKETKIFVRATKLGRLTLQGCAVQSDTLEARSADNRLAQPKVTTAGPPSPGSLSPS